jgi:type I restriction-modification system DNA methylase subunit
MTKEDLHTILRFPYLQSRWKEIVNAIFPNRDFFSNAQDVPFTTQAQRDKAERITRFGNIILDDGNELALYEVELKINEVNISRNRVGLRNLLNAEIIPGVVDGALIVYHQKGHDDWRFSFFSKTKYWDIEGNEVRKETHPKRYTYVLGNGETCVTPRERFWLLAEKKKKTIRDVLEAFSVEKVSDEFFARYKKCYLEFVDELCRADNKLARNVFGLHPGSQDDEEAKPIRDFVKKMLGRLVFLQFLQKKGWLDVPVEANYGAGNKKFLTNLFEQHENEHFYAKCLVPLFFETLNNSKDEIYKVTGTRFPFLNGGLFERDEIEKRPKADALVFPPSLFRRLFEFFGEYNFTIDENTPDDLDVGIDPEMLGHIFENLLEDNWKKGAFYTPKLFVQYMCQEALIQYLEIHLGKNEAISRFIRYADRGNEEDKNNFIRKNASAIEKLLDEVKICDPAIGSGAFPMGILQEIYKAKLALDWTLIDKKGEIKRQIIQHSIYGVDKERGAVDIARLRFWLSLIVDEEVKPGEKPMPLPNLDYKIVCGNSLLPTFENEVVYIDWSAESSGTVNQTLKHIENVRKTLNRIIERQKEFYSPEADKEKLKKEIRKLKIELLIEQVILTRKRFLSKADLGSGDLFNTKPTRKQAEDQRVAAHYDTVLEKLEKLKKEAQAPFEHFDWKLDFPEVLNPSVAGEPGFDIVIGNPPYIRQESITAIKPFLEKIDGKINYEVYNSTSDIYTYFFELGHKLLKPEKGVLTYICSKKYTRAKYGENLRRYLLKNTRITGYVDFNEVQIFGATVDTSIIFLQQNVSSIKDYVFQYCLINNDLKKNEPLTAYIENNGSELYSIDLNDNNWSFADKMSNPLINSIRGAGKLLKSWDTRINFGVKTGYNKAFYISNEIKEALIAEDASSSEIIFPILRGRNIDRYYCQSSEWVIFTRRGCDIDKFPAIKTHLLSYYEDLMPKTSKDDKRGRKPGPYKWHEIQDNVAYFDDFKSDKVVWIELSDKPQFALDKTGYFVDATGFIMTGKYLKYLLAVLNSKLSEWYFNFNTTSSGMGTNRWKKAYVEQIPIPEIPESAMRPFEILVDYITFIKKDDARRINPYTTNAHMAANFEELLDACVYELYFGEHMRERGIAVLDEVRQLLRPIDQYNEETEADKIAAEINAVYDRYKSPGNIIRQRIDSFPAQSPDIINVIQHG